MLMAPSMVLLFGIMAMCNAAVSNTATIKADGNGNIVAAVAEGNKVLLQEGAGAPVDIIGEIKKARREAVDASSDVDSQRRSNEVCDNGIEAKLDALVTIMNASATTAAAAAAAAAVAATAAAAAAAAEVAASESGSTSSPPPITWSAAVGNGCGMESKTPCTAAYDKSSAGSTPLVKLLVRTPTGGYYNQEGVYSCKYSMESSKVTVVTPSKLNRIDVLAGMVDCPHPIQDPKNTKSTAWSATVSLLEGGLEVPHTGVNGDAITDKQNVWFRAKGPVISGIPDEGVSVKKTDLVDGKAVISFTVDDQDSEIKDIVVTTDVSSNSDWIKDASFSAPDGNMFTLILTFDDAYDGALETDITIVAVDGQDQRMEKTFKFSIALFVSFWARAKSNVHFQNKVNFDYILGNEMGWTIGSESGFNGGTWQEGGDNFDTSSGVFTVPVAGIYLLSTSMRVDGADGSYVYLYADINGESGGQNFDPINGRKHQGKLLAVNGAIPNSYYSIQFSGSYMLDKGDKVDLRMFINSEKSMTFASNGGWGLTLVTEPTAAFLAYHATKYMIGSYGQFPDLKLATTYTEGQKSKGIYEIGGDNLNKDNGRFKAPSNGIYKFNLNTRVDKFGVDGSPPPSYMHIGLSVDFNDKKFPDSVFKGIASIEGFPQTNFQTMVNGAIFKLKKGQTVSVWFDAGDLNGNTPLIAAEESTFSGVRLGDDDLVGFHAMKKGDFGLATRSPTMIDSWEPRSNTFYSFNNGNHFDEKGGSFTAPVAGVYALEASVRFDEANGDYYRLAVCVNDEGNEGHESGHGIIRGETYGTGYWTASLSSTLRLNKDDTVKLCAYNGGQSGAVYIDLQSAWSMALVHKLG